MTEPDPAPMSTADALMQMSEIFADMRAWVNGVRIQLIDDGWSETQAEFLAATLFTALIKKSFE